MTTENIIKPISPEETTDRKKAIFPDIVIQTFNDFLAQRANGNNRIVIDEEEVVKLLVGKGLKRTDIDENRWLRVEDVFRANGWKVKTTNPGPEDMWDSFYTFTPQRNK